MARRNVSSTRVIRLCALVVAPVLAASVGAGQDVVVVPRLLLEHAEWPAIEFARALAYASVPAGVELREEDDLTRPPRRMTGELAGTMPVTELVARFNASHRDYAATIVDGVFVIRPRERRAAFLDSESTIDSPLTVTGVMAAMRTVFLPLMRPQPGTVVVGSGVGNDRLKALSAQLVLDGSGGRRVLDTLNQIVKQFPGAWVVMTRTVESQAEIVQYGFRFQNQSSSTSRIPR